mmetsp:Transcript_18434/g.38598  ORF Transcript_18434/g.38598 Transcript_18434/m.38598 type:complete len:214 (+) Transcript_18434:2673-3314(+)
MHDRNEAMPFHFECHFHLPRSRHDFPSPFSCLFQQPSLLTHLETKTFLVGHKYRDTFMPAFQCFLLLPHPPFRRLTFTKHLLPRSLTFRQLTSKQFQVRNQPIQGLLVIHRDPSKQSRVGFTKQPRRNSLSCGPISVPTSSFLPDHHISSPGGSMDADSPSMTASPVENRVEPSRSANALTASAAFCIRATARRPSFAQSGVSNDAGSRSLWR